MNKMSEVKNPDYKVLLPELGGREEFFELTPSQMRTVIGGAGPHRVAPFDKNVAVHERASSCESLVDIYPDAISVGGVLGSTDDRGNIAFGAWMSIPLTAMSFYLTSLMGYDKWYNWVFFTPAAFAFAVGCVYFFKVAYFTPTDVPILFNRVTREVTFSQLDFPRYWKFWSRPRFREPITVSWKSVQARSFKFTQFMGSTLRNSYRLEIWAPESEGSRKLLVKESIGYLGSYEDEKLWRLYEHIRRYMEEGGPAIQVGERMRKVGRGGKVSPFPEQVLQKLGGPPLRVEEIELLAQNGKSGELDQL